MRAGAERDYAAVVRELFDAFQSGDYGAIMSELREDVEFRNPEHAIEPGVRHGRAEFRRALENLYQVVEFSAEIEELRRIDDIVVVGYRAIGTARQSGIPIDQRFGQVWTFEDGKVKSMGWFSSFDDALAAASA